MVKTQSWGNCCLRSELSPQTTQLCDLGRQCKLWPLAVTYKTIRLKLSPCVGTLPEAFMKAPRRIASKKAVRVPISFSICKILHISKNDFKHFTSEKK